MKLSRVNNILIFLVLTVFILYFFQSYIIPLVIAILIWFVIRSVKQFLTRSRFIKNKFKNWLLNILALTIIVVVFSVFARVLGESVQQFTSKMLIYETNLVILNSELIKQFDFDFMLSAKTYFGEYDFSNLTSTIINDVSSFLGNSFIIFFYCLFLLLEETIFKTKFRLLFKNTSDLHYSNQVLNKIDESFGRYLSLKTMVSFCSAALCYIVLLVLEIDAPFLLALLIFVFSFIPTIGAIMAAIFPSIIATLQYAEFSQGLIVLIAVGTIIMIMGNIIEPKVMGKSLNISPFFVIIALVFWGAVWGIIGMILSVPITAIMIIVFQQFDSTKNISIILSENGELTDRVREENNTEN